MLSCSRSVDSKIAYSVDEKDLFPEGISFSKSMNSFYLSSIYKSKILRIDAENGRIEDFIKEGEYGYLSGVGLMVDDTKNYLWAIGSDNSDRNKGSKVFLFDIEKKTLINTYQPNDTVRHFFNDITIDSKGNIYVTDTYNNSIYVVDNEYNSIELLYKGQEIKSPNGIAISANGKYLYVASYRKGIHIIGIKQPNSAKSIKSIYNTKCIDGLKLYKNSLIGVQNGLPNRQQITRWYLDKSGYNIIKEEVLDCNNKYFDMPTTFTIVDDKLYCIANSQLKNLNQSDNSIKEKCKLKDIVLIEQKLK